MSAVKAEREKVVLEGPLDGFAIIKWGSSGSLSGVLQHQLPVKPRVNSDAAKKDVGKSVW